MVSTRLMGNAAVETDSVLLIDKLPVLRRGLRAVITAEKWLHVGGEAPDVMAALPLASDLRPRFIVADLPPQDPSALRRLLLAAPSARIVVFSSGDSARGEQLVKAGASAFVDKGSEPGVLIECLRAVASGRTMVAGGAPATRPRSSAELERLTPREREVLRLIAEGRTNRQIGVELGISPSTVDTHRTHLMRKLVLHDAQAVTRFAVRHGLVALD